MKAACEAPVAESSIGYLIPIEIVAAAIVIVVLLLSPLRERASSRLSLLGLCSAALACLLGLVFMLAWARFPDTREGFQDTAAWLVFTLSAVGFTLGTGSLRRTRRRLLSLGGMVLGPAGVFVAFFMMLVGRVH